MGKLLWISLGLIVGGAIFVASLPTRPVNQSPMTAEDFAAALSPKADVPQFEATLPRGVNFDLIKGEDYELGTTSPHQLATIIEPLRPDLVDVIMSETGRLYPIEVSK